MSNVLFGQNVLTNNFDPATARTGWGVRPSDWNIGVTLQQQIFTRASIEIAYSRRTFRGLTVSDNVLVQASDYQEYSLTAPHDSRLPDGGGYPITGLLDVSPAAVRGGQQSRQRPEKFGRRAAAVQRPRRDGQRAHAGQGFNIQGGTSTGQYGVGCV